MTNAQNTGNVKQQKDRPQTSTYMASEIHCQDKVDAYEDKERQEDRGKDNPTRDVAKQGGESTDNRYTNPRGGREGKRQVLSAGIHLLVFRCLLLGAGSWLLGARWWALFGSSQLP